MSKEVPASLAAFAGDVKHNVQWLAEQPAWPEVVAGYHAGIQVTVIRRWLVVEKGYADKATPSVAAIGRYLRDNHSRVR